MHLTAFISNDKGAFKLARFFGINPKAIKSENIILLPI